MPDRKLSEVIAYIVESMAFDARKLIPELRRHANKATPELHGYLNRIENSLRDFSTLIADLQASMSPAVRARIEQAG